MQPVRAPISRRRFLGKSAAITFILRGLRADVPGLKIGVTDWNLNLSADPEAVATAARLGFAGVQVSFGRKLADNKMPADNPQVIARYREMARQHGIQIDGTCVDRLHDNGLKSDPLASRWVLDSIRLTKDLGTQVLLLPFFGRWGLKSQAEMEHVGDLLRDLAPEAKKSGVVLGLEDTISAEDNVRIMERSRADNVLVYYDVGNSTVAGFDVVKEIRWLGKERICQMHLKDNPHFLGEGTIQFGPILQAVKDIGWTGWANLETDARPGQRDADMTRNLAFIRGVMKQV
jgi:L-ribulose-5-phosphate 3-epimerase